MYIIIPLAIMVASLAGAFYVASRKFVYLRKLDPSAVQDAPADFHDFRRGLFPEMVGAWKALDLRQHTAAFLTEMEKVLRKLRLVFLRVDTAMHQLIQKMRKTTEHHEKIQEKREADEAMAQQADSISSSASTVLDPREEEQRLIVEIAKNPKNPELYKELGMIYIEIGEDDDARQSFEKALELDPEDILVQNKLRKLKAE